MTKALFTKKDGTVVDLAKIELKFGELDPETQEALMAWPHGVEGPAYGEGRGWGTLGSPSWAIHSTYRAVPAPKAKKSKKPKSGKKSEIWLVIGQDGYGRGYLSKTVAENYARSRSSDEPHGRIIAIKRIKYRPGDGMEDV